MAKSRPSAQDETPAVVVGPEYVCPAVLPYGADILYFGRLIYCLPTGFAPLEHYALQGFPAYAEERSVRIPPALWGLHVQYFRAANEARRALQVLEPLRGRHVTVVALSYARTADVIAKASAALMQEPALLGELKQIPSAIPLVARETLSHVFLEVFLERGYSGVAAHLQRIATNAHDLETFLAAAVLNRLGVFARMKTPFAVYDERWRTVLSRVPPVLAERSADDEDDPAHFRVEHFRYKLFQEILNPVLGRCDTAQKSQRVAAFAKKRRNEVSALKAECGAIAREVVLANTASDTLRQEMLSDEILRRLVPAFADAVHEPRRRAVDYVKKVVLDSGVVGGLLSLVGKAGVGELGVVVAGAALAAAVDELWEGARKAPVTPGSAVLKAVSDFGTEAGPVEQQLRAIKLWQVEGSADAAAEPQ